jgi:hypothetical protein
MLAIRLAPEIGDSTLIILVVEIGHRLEICR